jgi:protoporphyrin/coproporphyrin ferrochelatase
VAGKGNDRRRLAVVFFNLGGPDSLKAVRPFLFNLFADPAIIRAPTIIRWPLALLISWLRRGSAKANYARMGGRSPLLPETEAQAEAVRQALAARAPHLDVRSFVAMRYWAPVARDTVKAVAAFEPDDVVLAPLYPQYSTTTTGSSFAQWTSLYRGPGRVRALCCYPAMPGLIEAHTAKILETWEAAGRPAGVRLLFSAHGLPEQVIEGGDPYQSQVEATAQAIAGRLGPDWADWRVCYQSRVGPMKWLGPSTLEMIGEAADDGRGVLIAPIAFVSEHVETLVELDHDYAVKAAALGCTPYLRAPALGLRTEFIEGLAQMVADALERADGVAPGSDFTCAGGWSQCPTRRS